jgi:uncharacterized membrane protein
MSRYASRVKKDIERWVADGLLDDKSGEALARDVEANDRASLSFGSILAMMAAVLLAAAILILVAANWDAFPRLLRVGALFAIIGGGYVGGAFLKVRDQPAFAEALWLIAAAAFGGALAMIGQMYHLAGDESQALVVWCLATALAAAALRSGPLTIASVVIAVAWLLLRGFAFWDDSPFPYLFIVVAAGLWVVSCWTRSEAARHLIMLAAVLYVVLLAMYQETPVMAGALAVVSAAAFALSVYRPDAVEKIMRLGGRLPVHGLVGFLSGMCIVQGYLLDENGSLVIAAAIALAGIAAAIVLAGRDSRTLRWIAYAGFGLQLCFIYVVTMGTMLGTAGLLLASGVVLGIAAFAITRIEKRMKVPPLAMEGAA